MATTRPRQGLGGGNEVGRLTLHPDKDELYQRLLPIYREHHHKNVGLYDTFAKLYDCGRGLTAGEAMEQALEQFGLIDIVGEKETMEAGALEYEEAMVAEE